MRLLIGGLVVLLCCSCGNTYYIVRHAEKAKPLQNMALMEAENPPLSDSGHLRALALKERLKSSNIKYIFSTNYKRTLSTAQPLDEYLLDVKTELYSPKKDSSAAFISRLKSIRHGNVLVVGHSNTIDDIANVLAGKTVVPGDLKETDYDNLFIIKRKGKRYRFQKETYGAYSE